MHLLFHVQNKTHLFLFITLITWFNICVICINNFGCLFSLAVYFISSVSFSTFTPNPAVSVSARCLCLSVCLCPSLGLCVCVFMCLCVCSWLWSWPRSMAALCLCLPHHPCCLNISWACGSTEPEGGDMCVLFDPWHFLLGSWLCWGQKSEQTFGWCLPTQPFESSICLWS